MRLSSRMYAVSAVSLAAMMLISCTNEQRNTQIDQPRGSRATPAQLAHEQAGDGLDFGEADQRARSGSRQAATPSASRAGRPSRETASEEPQGPVWSIVLNTFSGEGHERMARMYLAELPALSPELAQARVRSTERGSMVLYGTWAEPDDPRAVAALEYVKSITHQEIPVFPRAFLSRISVASAQQAQNPHALLSVRTMYPNVNPLYSLQVAAWSDFDTGQLSLQEIQRRAEAHAAELRSKGVQAFFHHDPNSRISVVTVGVFDRNAIDLETGVESAELRQLRSRFPHHLVNGEPLEELIDRRNPRRGTRVQEPRLVVVPRG